MTVSNAVWNAREVFVAQEAGSAGTLNFAGGTNALPDGLFVGFGSTGTVRLTAGLLSTTNPPNFTYPSSIGGSSLYNGSGVGQDDCVRRQVAGRRSGYWRTTNSEGTLTVSGGQVILTGSSAQMLVGGPGWGWLNAVSGAVLAQSICVGCTNGVSGELTTSGSSSITALSNLVVGDCTADGFGVVEMSGGTVYVTNATHDAVLDLRNGFFLLAGGSLVVDKLVPPTRAPASSITPAAR